MSEFVHRHPYNVSVCSTDKFRTSVKVHTVKSDGTKNYAYSDSIYYKNKERIIWRCAPLHKLAEKDSSAFLTMFIDSDQPESLRVNIESGPSTLSEPRDYREIQSSYKYVNGKLQEVTLYGGHISETKKSLKILDEGNFFLETEAFPIVQLNLPRRDVAVFDDMRHMLSYDELNPIYPPKIVEFPSSNVVEVSTQNMPLSIIRLTENSVQGMYKREDFGAAFTTAPLQIIPANYESVDPNKWYYSFEFKAFGVSFINPLSTFNNQEQV